MNIPAEFTIATAEQSQQLDADTVNNFGIDGFTLMEIAGTLAAQWLVKKVVGKSYGLFICGKGNNGGDALVVARYLVQHGIRADIVFVSGTDDLSPAAQKNYDLLRLIDENDEETNLTFDNSWGDFDQSLRPDFIVDGMLGTGLNSNLRGDYSDAVQWANQNSAPVFAMDIPTGLHADNGRLMGEAIRATKTFAFGVRKQGYYIADGPGYTGEIIFCELPFPNYISRDFNTYLINEACLTELETKRARHKYEAGIVYLIAGSEGLTGAAIMAAKSAWARGLGAVILVCPRGLLPVFENNLPQIIKKPVGKQDDLFFKGNHLDEVSTIIKEKEGVILLGSGIGREQETVHFVTDFLAQTGRKIVIDADGLWALAQNKKWAKPANASWILTPHPGELSTLLGGHFENDMQRLQQVKETADKKNITLLSKGSSVIVGTTEGAAHISAYDTRVFSRAGFGDVLAGKVAAFKALGYSQTECCIRALLHGEARINKLLDKGNKIPEPIDLI